MKHTVFFWQNSKFVSATVTASSKAVAERVVRRSYAGVEIVRVERAADESRHAIRRSR